MSDQDIPPGATGVITIDLDRLAANWRSLSGLVGPAQCAAVVKADAYGLGAERVVPALRAAGCTTFFIATVDEAAATRALVPDAEIYVLNGLPPGAAPELLSANAIPVLSSLAEIAEWASLSRSGPVRPPAALHIDTGLNRLGLGPRDVDALAADAGTLRTLDIRLVMSHLASADDPSDPKNAIQLETFNRQRRRLPAAPASLAASDGLMLGAPFQFDLVRPGYAIYGGQAFKGGPTPVAPVVSVQARILQVRDIAAGETVGYSATWAARRPSRIATLAAGYADGFARSLSATNDHAGGAVRVAGQLCPVVGRVSMDLITVDVTDLAGPGPEPGQMVELVGPDLSLERMGAAAGTIGYEVLTRLGRRFHRIYIGGAEDIPSYQL